MKPRLSDLLNSNYGSTIEYHYDLAHAEGDGVVIQAIEDKLARSMSTITGAQPAPTSRQKNLSVQMFPDGSIAVGPAADVAKIRIDTSNEANAVSKQSTDSFDKFRKVTVKS